MERSAATSYLVCAEGPPFLAIGPMDKNAQLHWTFRWPSCPVCNNYEFCVLWPSNAVLRKVVPTATCLPKRAEVVTRPGGNAARQPSVHGASVSGQSKFRGSCRIICNDWK